MTADDIPAAMRLKDAAGWNQTERDWSHLLTLAPESCWVCQSEGEIAGSTTVVAYGEDLAWIGMVLVLPAYRRRGIARALMEEALAFCERRQIRCVKLDATEMGRPLYASLGFADEQPVERWERRVASDLARLTQAQSFALDKIWDLDRRAFGADRRAALTLLSQAFPDGVACAGDGYALARPGSRARFLGPAVSRSASAALAVIDRLLSGRRAEAWYWDLLPANREAVRLARSLEFEPVRRLTRMARGGCAARDAGADLIWATGGFELG